MIKLLKTMLLTLLSTIILSAGNCGRPTEPLPWAENFGRFYTLDLARAQEEIPFPIVLPSYVPDKRNHPPPPNITGPLREYQYDNRVDVMILYIVDLGGEIPALIQIWEYNYPVLPGDPKLNPGLEMREIRGKGVVKGGVAHNNNYYFDRNGIWFVIEFRDFPDELAINVIESILE